MTHTLTTPKGWGPISTEQVRDLDTSIFPCGICSTSDAQVYHNILGRHNHVEVNTLRTQRPEAFL